MLQSALPKVSHRIPLRKGNRHTQRSGTQTCTRIDTLTETYRHKHTQSRKYTGTDTYTHRHKTLRETCTCAITRRHKSTHRACIDTFTEGLGEILRNLDVFERKYYPTGVIKWERCMWINLTSVRNVKWAASWQQSICDAGDVLISLLLCISSCGLMECRSCCNCRQVYSHPKFPWSPSLCDSS